MRRTTALALATLPLAAAGPSACGAEEDKDAFALPAGVVEQYEVLAEEIAEKGKTVESGAWTVNLITEAAEPWHEVHGMGHTEFRDVQAGETNHIEIIPVDTASGRIVPDVPITLEVIDADGKVVAKQKLNFYGSTFFHYANNFSIAEAGTYTIKATLEAPTFPWHGAEDEAPALSDGAVVEFDGVELGAA
jgi:hypothetical protein